MSDVRAMSETLEARLLRHMPQAGTARPLLRDAAAEIARLTRELEAARERERVDVPGLPDSITPLTGVFRTHHAGRPHAIVLWRGAPWLVWQHPDGHWVTEAKVQVAALLRTPRGEGEAVRVPGAVERPCDCAGCHCANVGDAEEVGYADGWNACRDAMLAALRSEAQGGEERR